MGFYSFNTADTKRSINNRYSGKETFPVAMTSPDGRKFIENNYEGYGEFGGKDIYDLIAELNNLENRDKAIDIIYSHNGFKNSHKAGLKVPKITENLSLEYSEIKGFSEDCIYQGYFYDF